MQTAQGYGEHNGNPQKRLLPMRAETYEFNVAATKKTAVPGL